MESDIDTLKFLKKESVQIYEASVIKSSNVDDDIDRNLFCTICQEILKIPRECSVCNNNFCKKCIDTWLKSKSTCPFRCEKLEIKKSHRIIIDSLKRLTFNCKNKKNGCSKILDYDNFAQHCQVCDFNMITCINDKCNKEFFMMNLEYHINEECDYHVHKCKFCGFQIMGKKNFNHDCNKQAYNQFCDVKSQLDNFMLKMQSKIDNINKSHKGISDYFA